MSGAHTQTQRMHDPLGGGTFAEILIFSRFFSPQISPYARAKHAYAEKRPF